MRQIINIKDKHIEIEVAGINMLYPLENVIVFTEKGSVRGDIMMELYEHASNQMSYGGCPKECEVCKGFSSRPKVKIEKYKLLELKNKPAQDR